MTAFALSIVLLSAFIHASWNLLAKRAGGGAPFVWLCSAFSAAIYAPLALAVIVLQHPHLGPREWFVLLINAGLQLAYFLALQRGYRAGDFSLVYPMARGIGPLLSMAAAILFLGEHPVPVAVAGALLIVAGVLVLTGDPRRLGKAGAGRAVAYGVLTGSLIAAYTVLAKYAVGQLAVPPILLDYSANLGQLLFLMPFALRHRDDIRNQWQQNGREAIGVGILSPLAYILVLSVLVFTPVSYVAPMREISILISTVMGARLLSEGNVKRRLVAASIMVVGVMALAFR